MKTIQKDQKIVRTMDWWTTLKFRADGKAFGMGRHRNELRTGLGGWHRVSEGFLHKGNEFLAGLTMKERNVVFMQVFLSWYQMQFNIICMLVMNPLHEVLCIYLIQAPTMLYTIWRLFNPILYDRFQRDDHCKWKILGRVGSCCNIYHQVFWSSISNTDVRCRTTTPACVGKTEYGEKG